MNYYVGIDLGGTNIKGMIMNDRLQVIIKKIFPTPQRKPPEETFTAIINLVEAMMGESAVCIEDVLGIGIGIPGLIDSRVNKVFNAANLLWSDMDVGIPLRDYFKKPVYAENDGNVNALGEMYFGAGKGFGDIVLLTLGTGLGSGIVVGGQLLHGASHVAGEVGHMVIESDGELCSCGKRGCFESCCSATAMVRYARKFAIENPDTLLLKYASGNPLAITCEMIDYGFDAGDAVSQKTIETFAQKLSIGLVNLINLFNPEVIIIGGGLSRSGERILKPVRKQVEDSLMHPVQRCKILAGELGSDAGVMGACSIVAAAQRVMQK